MYCHRQGSSRWKATKLGFYYLWPRLAGLIGAFLNDGSLDDCSNSESSLRCAFFQNDMLMSVCVRPSQLVAQAKQTTCMHCSCCLFCRADRLQGREPDLLENLPFEKTISICNAKNSRIRSRNGVRPQLCWHLCPAFYSVRINFHEGTILQSHKR